MKILIFTFVWVGLCLLIGGRVIPSMNDDYEYPDTYCSTGGNHC